MCSCVSTWSRMCCTACSCKGQQPRSELCQGLHRKTALQVCTFESLQCLRWRALRGTCFSATVILDSILSKVGWWCHAPSQAGSMQAHQSKVQISRVLESWRFKALTRLLCCPSIFAGRERPSQWSWSPPPRVCLRQCLTPSRSALPSQLEIRQSLHEPQNGAYIMTWTTVVELSGPFRCQQAVPVEGILMSEIQHRMLRMCTGYVPW